MPLLTSPQTVKLPSGSPTDGQVAAVLDMRLRPGEILDVDFSSFASRAESIYCDNTQNTYAVTYTFADTKRIVTVPPGCELCLPTFSHSSTVTIANLDPTNRVVTRALLFTCSKPVYERYPGSSALRTGGVLQPAGALSQSSNYVSPGPYIPPPPPIGDVWNATLAAQRNVALSNGGLTAKIDAAAATLTSATFATYGKYYFEISLGSGGNPLAGLASPNGSTLQYNVKDSPYITANGGGPNLGTPTSDNIHTQIAVNVGAALAWIRGQPGTPWNGNASADPVTGANGISLVFMGAGGYAPWISAVTSSNSTFNLLASNQSAYTGVVPAGYTAGWPSGVSTGG